MPNFMYSSDIYTSGFIVYLLISITIIILNVMQIVNMFDLPIYTNTIIHIILLSIASFMYICIRAKKHAPISAMINNSQPKYTTEL